jgi:hypothetical protein
MFPGFIVGEGGAVAPSQIHNGRLQQGVREVPQSNFRSLRPTALSEIDFEHPFIARPEPAGQLVINPACNMLAGLAPVRDEYRFGCLIRRWGRSRLAFQRLVRRYGGRDVRERFAHQPLNRIVSLGRPLS